jgi:hypothetical protein
MVLKVQLVHRVLLEPAVVMVPLVQPAKRVTPVLLVPLVQLALQGQLGQRAHKAQPEFATSQTFLV